MASRIQREGAGERHRGSIGGSNVSPLAERGYGGGHDSFGKSFLVDIGHIKDFESVGAAGGVEVFAPQGHIENLPGVMRVRLLQLPGFEQVLFIIVRVGKLMQMAANGGLGLILFGPYHCVKTIFARTDIGIAPKEIHGAGAETEQLRHNGVVVIVFGEMAIGACFGCADTASGMREMRIKGLAAVAFG